MLQSNATDDITYKLRIFLTEAYIDSSTFLKDFFHHSLPLISFLSQEKFLIPGFLRLVVTTVVIAVSGGVFFLLTFISFGHKGAILGI